MKKEKKEMKEEKPKFLGFRRIPWNQLVRCPLNPRTDYGNLVELQDTIEQDGILDDLVVRTTKDPNKFEVVCGERRREAGQGVTKDAPCKVYEMSNRVARRWMAIEDYQKEIWRPYERGKFYLEWIKHENLTQKDLAAIVGCSRSKIQDYVDFAKRINPEVGKNVAVATLEGKSESKTLTFGKARKLTTLVTAVQNALAKRILIEGMSEKEVSKQIDNIKEIQTDISNCEDEELKSKAVEQFLKPEKLVKTEPFEVKVFLGLPTKPSGEWLSFTKLKTKLQNYVSKIPEVEKIEHDEEKKIITIYYKEKAPDQEQIRKEVSKALSEESPNLKGEKDEKEQ